MGVLGCAGRRWRDGQPIDVHEEMTRLTLEIVAECLFGADVRAEAKDVGMAMTVALEDFSSQRRLIRIPAHSESSSGKNV
jgi:cytochrome P450